MVLGKVLVILIQGGQGVVGVNEVIESLIWNNAIFSICLKLVSGKPHTYGDIWHFVMPLWAKLMGP